MSEFKLGPLQTKWLEALESGEYEKGQFRLKSLPPSKPRYCCLGVANEVLCLGEEQPYCLDGTYHRLGLNGPGGEFTGDRVQLPSGFVADGLADLNDEGVPFAEIAALIRSRPQDFFTESK